ncbi:MAG: hypothetical protein HWE14_00690 [Flavobacteriia bacterium]|nr:hypothetical protein [Flavobacteriia bacterium]
MANGSMISKAEAKALVDRFKANPTKTTSACQAMLYDLSMIEQLKNAAPEGTTITSVRVYFGMNEDFSLCSVLVGCDAEGNNYYGGSDDMCLDNGTKCPDDCGGDGLGS